MGKSKSLPLAEQHDQEAKKPERKIILIASAALLVLITLLSLILYFQISTNRKMAQYFASLKEFIEIQNGIIYDQILSSTAHLENLTKEQTDSIIDSISTTNRRVIRIEQVYGALLDEQKKRTLESLYDESLIIDRYELAEKLFRERKYRQAYDEFSFVVAEQSENLNALFFKYYSLFLINKGDQSQYRIIKNSFLQLQRHGYSKPEIQEVLDFISDEESPSAQHNKEDIQ